jgi:hypothetical protein
LIGRIPKIRALWYKYRLRRAVKSYGPYDVIHIHYVGSERLRYAMSAIRPETRLVVSFWGSDIYRQNLNHLLRLRKYLNVCTVITLATKRMLRTFRDVYGEQYEQKIRPVLFGISTLETIDETRKILNKQRIKEQLGIDPGSLVVSVGYSRSEAQQHDKVLEVLSGMPETQLKKITFLLPLTYGNCSADYEGKLLALLDNIPSEKLLVRGFQTTEQIARLRLATDIYINAQTTDAFSASVQEYLYAGALLLNPVWLKYDELNDWNAYYQEYQQFSDLPNLIEKVIQNGLPDLQNNASIIMSKTSWEAVRQGWLDIYKSP